MEFPTILLQDGNLNHDIEVSVVMPCLNEEQTIAICIRKALTTLARLGMKGEVIIADNGSTDRSVEIAESLGVRVVHEPRKGYGNALMAGFEAARGKFIIMADADDSYDLTDLERFIRPLREGADLVMGTRLKGTILPGAMRWKNRHIGNPVLSGILNLFFRTGVSDCHSGMRAFKKAVLEKMQLRCPGMEFASEMVIKASKASLRIVEIPITLYPDGRNRQPHLRPWRDGWRHLKFILMFSPTWLFLIPGTILMLLGVTALTALSLVSGTLYVGPFRFDTHWAVFGSLLAILGYQVIHIGVFARIYSVTHRFLEMDRVLDTALQVIRLETGLVVGVVLTALGFGIDLYVLLKWIQSNLGPLDELRTSLLGSTLMVIGIQTIFSSFFLSILGDEYERRRDTSSRQLYEPTRPTVVPEAVVEH